MEDLDKTVRDEIDALFIQARGKFKAGEKSEAIQDAAVAWKMLPEPKFGWDVSMSYTHALAKIYRDTGNFPNAIALMNELFASGTAEAYEDGPRFVTATIYFEMGDNENAMKWFDEANRISKGRCFQGEDKKYKEFYKSRAAGK